MIVYIYYNIALLPILLILIRRKTSYYTFYSISHKSYLLSALLGVLLDICLALTSGSPLTTSLIINIEKGQQRRKALLEITVFALLNTHLGLAQRLATAAVVVAAIIGQQQHRCGISTVFSKYSDSISIAFKQQ